MVGWLAGWLAGWFWWTKGRVSLCNEMRPARQSVRLRLWLMYDHVTAACSDMKQACSCWGTWVYIAVWLRGKAGWWAGVGLYLMGRAIARHCAGQGLLLCVELRLSLRQRMQQRMRLQIYKNWWCIERLSSGSMSPGQDDDFRGLAVALHAFEDFDYVVAVPGCFHKGRQEIWLLSQRVFVFGTSQISSNKVNQPVEVLPVNRPYWLALKPGKKPQLKTKPGVATSSDFRQIAVLWQHSTMHTPGHHVTAVRTCHLEHVEMLLPWVYHINTVIAPALLADIMDITAYTHQTDLLIVRAALTDKGGFGLSSFENAMTRAYRAAHLQAVFKR